MIQTRLNHPVTDADRKINMYIVIPQCLPCVPPPAGLQPLRVVTQLLGIGKVPGMPRLTDPRG